MSASPARFQVENALANLRLSGIEPSARALALGNAVSEGWITAGQAIEILSSIYHQTPPHN